MLLPAAGGHDQHRTLAGERALAIAVAPAPVAVLANAIGKNP
jgi:hypothetical protein